MHSGRVDLQHLAVDRARRRPVPASTRCGPACRRMPRAGRRCPVTGLRPGRGSPRRRGPGFRSGTRSRASGFRGCVIVGHSPGWAQAAVSAGRRRSGSARREQSMSAGVDREAPPTAAAMWTLRATSSHMTAALTAARPSRADGEDPWFRMRTAGDRLPLEGLHDPASDRVVPDQGEGPYGNQAHRTRRRHGQHAGDRLAARSPGRRVRRVGVHHAADLRHAAGRRRPGHRCPTDGECWPSTTLPRRSQTTMLSGVRSS